jgi:hypothetical protein
MGDIRADFVERPTAAERISVGGDPAGIGLASEDLLID